MVTDYTIRSAKLGVVDSVLDRIPEGFLADAVTHRERGEECPLVSAWELARAIVAAVYLKEVDALVVVVDATKEASRTLVCVRGCRGVVFVGECQLRHVRILNAVFLEVEILIVGLVEVGTNHDVQVVGIVEELSVVEVSVEYLVLIYAVVCLNPGRCSTAVRWSRRSETPSVVEVGHETNVFVLGVLADEGVVAVEGETM